MQPAVLGDLRNVSGMGGALIVPRYTYQVDDT